MLLTTPPQALAVFLGMVALLVGECRSSAAHPAAQEPFNINATQTTAQQLLNYNFPASELAWSLMVNQMTLLRMLNESSNICSSRERDLLELRDLKLELNATTEEVMKELQDKKEATIIESDARHEKAKEELNSLKEAALNEVDTRNEEAKQRLQEVKEAAVNEVDARNEEAKQRLQEVKEAAVNEVDARNEEAKQRLQEVNEAALDEMDNTMEVLNSLRERMETALDEMNASKQELLTVKEATLTELQQATARRKTYRLFTNAVTQPEAVRACGELGGRLALPMNEEEKERIVQTVQSNDSTSGIYFWIAADDKQEEGKWIDTVTGQPLRYTDFAGVEPNNANGDEDCVTMRPDKYTWNDLKCTRQRDYVCEFI